MAFLGKSEKEIRTREEMCEQKENALTIQQAKLSELSNSLTAQSEELREREEQLAQNEQKLQKEIREYEEMARNAKNNFYQQQDEVFREVMQKIADREAALKKVEEESLDQIRCALENAQEIRKKNAEEDWKNLEKRSEFIQQELTEREERIQKNAEETKARLQEKEAEILQRESELLEKENEIARREREILQREMNAQSGFVDQNQKLIEQAEILKEQLEMQKKHLEERENTHIAALRKLEQEKENLQKRELAIREAEVTCENGFIQKQEKFEKEFAQKRETLEKELTLIRQNKEMELAQSLTARLETLEREWVKQREEKLQNFQEEIQRIQTSFEESQKAAELHRTQEEERLSTLQAELDEKERACLRKEKRLEAREQTLEQETANLENQLEKRVSDLRKNYEMQIREKETALEECRANWKRELNLREVYAQLEVMCEGNPQQMIAELNARIEEIAQKEKALMEPSQKMRQELAMHENVRLQNESKIMELESKVTEYASQLRDQTTLEGELALSEEKVKGLTIELQNVKDTLDRIYNANVQKKQGEIEDIETPCEKFTNDYIAKRGMRANPGEVEWLKDIYKECQTYGFQFPERILKAFHTSLKSAEMSPLTVLAGVSGTGKSQLPELYARYGGLNFFSQPVLPTWDSTESMLGFFNSITGKYEAQPLLRLLVQTQKEKGQTDYPSLSEHMTLVLLDEMNLAHVELYFADFLSKLEERRGKIRAHLPNLEIKLGPQSSYSLPMGRNVLWVGTMNQDETTKSLSDKVIDRGTIINFPRPKILKSRDNVRSKEETKPLINKSTWNEWCTGKIELAAETRQSLKQFVEEMNSHLEVAGRALGHRVWQSIEYYIANYPDICAKDADPKSETYKQALRNAFEDQLVQKVMPKLRGIETIGKTKTECLDKIFQQLNDKGYPMAKDFKYAMEIGNGQFIWSSANYLTEGTND